MINSNTRRIIPILYVLFFQKKCFGLGPEFFLNDVYKFSPYLLRNTSFAVQRSVGL